MILKRIQQELIDRGYELVYSKANNIIVFDPRFEEDSPYTLFSVGEEVVRKAKFFDDADSAIDHVNGLTPSVVEELEKLVERKVTIYTTDGFGTIFKTECVIKSVEESKYAQYSDGIRIIARIKRKRKNSVIRCYRGWECMGADGIVRQLGRELVVVPGWGGEDLRMPSEVIDRGMNIVIVKQPGLHFKNFPYVKSKARSIDGSVIFEVLDDQKS